MKYLYHKDCPDGRLFEDDEKPKGWVDTPAKLKPAKADGDGS